MSVHMTSDTHDPLIQAPVHAKRKNCRRIAMKRAMVTRKKSRGVPLPARKKKGGTPAPPPARKKYLYNVLGGSDIEVAYNIFFLCSFSFSLIGSGQAFVSASRRIGLRRGRICYGFSSAAVQRQE